MAAKLPPTTVQVDAYSSKIWTGRLYAWNADPKYDDPLWDCKHPHDTKDEATACARREGWAVRFSSDYARMLARGETDLEVMEDLLQIDGLLALTEKALTEAGEAGEVLADTICNRIAIAFDKGRSACKLPHCPDEDR
jgi:hypothetical protein